MGVNQNGLNKKKRCFHHKRGFYVREGSQPKEVKAKLRECKLRIISKIRKTRLLAIRTYEKLDGESLFIRMTTTK